MTQNTRNARILTGIKPTGNLHLGNYIGAIRPALDKTKQNQGESLFFIADCHALTTIHRAKDMQEYILDAASTWLACGLDPSNVIFYKQSDIPEIFELAWILACFAPKGLLNRAHAYKAVTAKNEQDGKKDVDIGVSMGLFNYPVLMAADILMFDVEDVPVGKDQKQHIEIAQSIANRVNHHYKQNLLTVPNAVIDEDNHTIKGLDGQKMSKSYGNTIPIFCTSKKRQKLINKIVTDSSDPASPKNPDDSQLMDLFCLFSTQDEIAALRADYQNGIGWADVKRRVFEHVDRYFARYQDKYYAYKENPEKVIDILDDGKKRARAIAKEKLKNIKDALGVL